MPLELQVIKTDSWPCRVIWGRAEERARRASSMRGLIVAMPWSTLPAIEPEASNTIMASSLQGGGVKFCGLALTSKGNLAPP